MLEDEQSPFVICETFVKFTRLQASKHSLNALKSSNNLMEIFTFYITNCGGNLYNLIHTIRL